jgi:transcriptional regulator with XRE-family HTH domain
MQRAARATGLSYKTIQNYCAGKTQPCEEAVQIIVEELGIPVDELMGEQYARYAESRLRREREHKALTEAYDCQEAAVREILMEAAKDPNPYLIKELAFLWRDLRSTPVFDTLFRVADQCDEAKQKIAEATWKIIDEYEFAD